MKGIRKVLLPAPRSFCAGVERAIDIVERLLERYGPPIYVRNQIVHNVHVVNDLASRGVVFVRALDEVPPGALVVFSAHGVAPTVHEEADVRGLDAVDATCPLVSKVHMEARRAADADDSIILIGHADHEEVIGTMGVAPERTHLVECIEDVDRLEVADPTRLTYVCQTTLSVNEVDDISAVLHRRFPEIKGPKTDDICYATTNRQLALSEVIAEADLVLVIGSENSSNSNRLVELAWKGGAEAYRIDSVDEIKPEWLSSAAAVAVTAGASAPPSLVDDVVADLAKYGPVEVVERRVADENMEFLPPPRLRS